MARIYNSENTLSIKTFVEYLYKDLSELVPFVNINTGCLGGDTLYLVISLQPKNEWNHGILENSQYFRMSIDIDGSMEVFTQCLYKKGQRNYEGRVKTKFRRCKATHLGDVVERIKKFIDKVNVEVNE